MDSIVVGMFDEADEAHAVVADLEAKGVPSHHISIDITNERTDQAEALKARSFFQKMGDAITGRDLKTLDEGVRRGSTLVSARVEEPLVDEAVALMKEHGAVDIDERSASWREEGWKTQETDFGDKVTERAEVSGDVVLPVVEESLKVGKREVQRGGVRVFSQVTERPVEEQVNLRQERVVVERRPVDRPVDSADAGLFQDASFEVNERSEEVVVGKEARVVEEVVVGKDVSQRVETVRDTVRRTDVGVEQLADIDRFNDDFREHYRTRFASEGHAYDDYAPAYRYGYQLAEAPHYKGRAWNDLESDVQTSWERQNPGTWARFKDAIRYGWDRLTGQSTAPKGR